MTRVCYRYASAELMRRLADEIHIPRHNVPLGPALGTSCGPTRRTARALELRREPVRASQAEPLASETMAVRSLSRRPALSCVQRIAGDETGQFRSALGTVLRRCHLTGGVKDGLFDLNRAFDPRAARGQSLKARGQLNP